MHIVASFNRHWPFGQRGRFIRPESVSRRSLHFRLQLLCCCWRHIRSHFDCHHGRHFSHSSRGRDQSIQLTATDRSIHLEYVRQTRVASRRSLFFYLECILGSWIYGSVWILPPLFGWNRFILEGFRTSCTFDYTSRTASDRSFIIFLVAGGFLIPLSTIIVSYAFILRKLFTRGRRMTAHNIDDDSHSLTSAHCYVYYYPTGKLLNEERSRSITTVIQSNGTHSIARNARHTEVRATRTAICICTIFCAAWGPYAAMAIATQCGYDHFLNPFTSELFSSLAKLAACVNPLIYALSSAGFRKYIFYKGALFSPQSPSIYNSRRKNTIVKSSCH